MKKALLFLVEGPHDTKLGMAREKMAELLGQRGYTVQSYEHDMDYPGPVTLILGSMVKFATAYRQSDNGQSMEANLEGQTVGFKAWLKPIIRDMAKDIWYGKTRPPEKPVET